MATFTVTTLDDVVAASDGRLSLREAIDLANATAGTDTIDFARSLEGGRVVLTGGELTVTDHVRIDGDGDNNGTGITIDAAGADRVMSIGGTGTAASLESLSITGGHLADGDGAGVLVRAGNSLSLSNCSINNNSIGNAQNGHNHHGAGLAAEESAQIFITNSVIVDNANPYGSGGGIFLSNDSIIAISNSNIDRNTSKGFYTGGPGGGVYLGARVTASIDNSSISNNWGDGGGGIFVGEDSSLRMIGSIVRGNHGAEDNPIDLDGKGGGILLLSGSLQIESSAIISNDTDGYGGGICVDGGSLSISNSTLANNSAGIGGAIHGSGRVDIANSTITGNSVYSPYSKGSGQRGGGVSSDGGSLSISNSIVSGNFTSYVGYYPNGYRVFDDVTGTIAASNGHNIFGSLVNGAIAGDLLNVDPSRLFAAIDPGTGGGVLALNGGPTPTVALRDAPDNPALGGADPASAGSTDQRGVARAQPGGSNPDIGAFELRQSFVSSNPTPGNDVLTGTAKANTLSGLDGHDLLLGLGGNDVLRGGAGGDTLVGGLGNDTLDGGDGLDTASWRDATAGITASLVTNRSSGVMGIDTLTGIENLEGGAFADTLTGNDGVNTLSGGRGDDKLYGLGGDDRLFGGEGNDLLEAGQGNDVIDGGAGIDLVSWFQDGGGGVTVDLRTGTMTRGGETDILIGIENADGTANADVIYGDHLANALGGGNGADTLYGRKGDDILAGGLGNDVLDGGAGFDLASFALGGAVTVDLSGTTDVARRGTETDRLVGIEGAIGSANADRMIGDAGANLFRGGPGKDTLTGGAGRDTFDYDSLQDSPVGTGRDVITDFTRGEDRIDLSGIDANTSAAGDQAFTRWVGTGPAGAAGSLGYAIVGGNTVIHGNVDGDAAWEFEIQLTGTKVLSLADFVL